MKPTMIYRKLCDGNTIKSKCFQRSHTTPSLTILCPNNPHTDARRSRNRGERQQRFHASLRLGHHVSDTRIIKSKGNMQHSQRGL